MFDILIRIFNYCRITRSATQPTQSLSNPSLSNPSLSNPSLSNPSPSNPITSLAKKKTPIGPAKKDNIVK